MPYRHCGQEAQALMPESRGCNLGSLFMFSLTLPEYTSTNLDKQIAVHQRPYILWAAIHNLETALAVAVSLTLSIQKNKPLQPCRAKGRGKRVGLIVPLPYVESKIGSILVHSPSL